MKIQLSKGMTAIVDEADYALLSQFQWKARIRKEGLAYAYRKVGRQFLLMHRIIIAARDGFEVDHINGNSLDNRRANLRECTHAENLRNRNKSPLSTHQFKGIGIDRKRSEKSRRYYATIQVGGKKISAGKYFHTELEAAKAYDDLATQYHGEFARLNFPK